jgi:phosphoglycolate phosphatase-like HAD superfamily hydrolase
VAVAIATGCWRPTISLKLAAAGIDVEGLPMATCSDRQRRSEIITLAAERAGKRMDQAVYVGDGGWDLFACRELGIPLIATGRNAAELQRLGAAFVQPVFAPDAFLDLVREAGLAVASSTLIG